ncbi:hypothetical protein [Cetobacterium sp.]|uniref:hypothetical protein n=1 Tax=Cetobacterium sp. TaxID=2071632 RepID=UPI003F3E1F00
MRKLKKLNQLNKKIQKKYFGKIRIDYTGEKVLKIIEMERNTKSGYEIRFKKNIPIKIIKWKLGKKTGVIAKNLKLKSLLKNFNYSFKIVNNKCMIKSFSSKENLKSELVEIQTEILRDNKIEVYTIKGYGNKVRIYPMFEAISLNKN